MIIDNASNINHNDNNNKLDLTCERFIIEQKIERVGKKNQ